jgi:hypothetical protein
MDSLREQQQSSSTPREIKSGVCGARIFCAFEPALHFE